MKIFKKLFPYLIIITIVILVRFFIIAPVKVTGFSMHPTLEDRQSLLLNKLSYKIGDVKRFDIIVIDTVIVDNPLIKRVVGLPNEHVKYENNKLYINGKVIEEKFKPKKTTNFDLKELGYDVIPKDKYFVVGDNRDNSQDSRIIGLIDKEDIMGKINICFYPFNRLGKVN